MWDLFSFASIAGWCSIIIVFGLAIVYFRVRLIGLLPQSLQAHMGLSGYGRAGSSGAGSSTTRGLYARLPTYSWTASRLAGLHSTLFDIEANIRDGDQRTGLESIGAQEIERLMNSEGVDFDTARLMLNRQRFAKHNIDPRTGMPLDSKAVTFENLR